MGSWELFNRMTDPKYSFYLHSHNLPDLNNNDSTKSLDTQGLSI